MGYAINIYNIFKIVISKAAVSFLMNQSPETMNILQYKTRAKRPNIFTDINRQDSRHEPLR